MIRAAGVETGIVPDLRWTGEADRRWSRSRQLLPTRMSRFEQKAKTLPLKRLLRRPGRGEVAAYFGRTGRTITFSRCSTRSPGSCSARCEHGTSG